MMGRGHLGGFLGNRSTQVVAVCDVHRVRREDALNRVHLAYAAERKSGTYRGCAAYVDFRSVGVANQSAKLQVSVCQCDSA